MPAAILAPFLSRVERGPKDGRGPWLAPEWWFARQTGVEVEF